MRPPTHPPGYDNRKESKTYEYRIRCSNCEEWTTFDVPKGVLAADFISKQICPICECRDTFFENVGE